jgi:hypothetical protein
MASSNLMSPSCSCADRRPFGKFRVGSRLSCENAPEMAL